MLRPRLRPQPERILENLLYDAKRQQPKIDWLLTDNFRGVELLEPEMVYQGQVYRTGDSFVTPRKLAISWETQGRVKIVSVGHVDQGSVTVYYPDRKETRAVPVLKPWAEPHPDHPELGPVKLHYSDLYLRVAVRQLTEALRERFDLPPLTPVGYQFFSDFVSVRKAGYSIGSDPFGAPVWGEPTASLLVFYPQIPA